MGGGCVGVCERSTERWITDEVECRGVGHDWENHQWRGKGLCHKLIRYYSEESIITLWTGRNGGGRYELKWRRRTKDWVRTGMGRG